MKKLLYSLPITAILLMQSLMASATFSYTGYARDCNCSIISTGTITVTVSIISVNANGTLLYKETHTNISVIPGGKYTITNVGGGTPVSGTFPTSWTATEKYYIKVKVGSSEEVTQRLIISGGNPIVDPAPAYIAENAGVVRYFENGERMQFYNGTSWVNICCGDACNWVYCGDIDPCGGVTELTIVDPAYPSSPQLMPLVGIGCRCWFAKNLNIGEMKNTPPLDNQNPANGIIEKYCYNNIPANCTTYGGLYKWDELMNNTIPQNENDKIQGICPLHWHIPLKSEMEDMVNLYGGDLLFGSSVFSNNPNIYPNTTSHLDLILSGYVQELTPWSKDLNFSGNYATSKVQSNDLTRFLSLFVVSYPQVPWLYVPKSNAVSVRCVKD